MCTRHRNFISSLHLYFSFTVELARGDTDGYGLSCVAGCLTRKLYGNLIGFGASATGDLRLSSSRPVNWTNRWVVVRWSLRAR